jgi:hypothetical protein
MVGDLSKSKKLDESKALTKALTAPLTNFPDAQLDDTKPITLGTARGLEAVYSIPNIPKLGPAKIRTRVVFAKQHLYQVQVLYPAGSAIAADADKFVDSFALAD